MKIIQWIHMVGFLVQKEFRQIFRDRAMLRVIFIAPLIQLLILSYATTTDLRNIRIAVLDEDHTAESRTLSTQFYQNNIFIPAPVAESPAQLQQLLMDGKADITVWIPRGYAGNVAAGKQSVVAMAVNGQNSSIAGRAQGYAEAIVRGAANEILQSQMLKNPELAQRIHRIDSVTRFFYNPQLESRYYMVPAIVVILLSLIAGMLTGMAIVKEKEVGTLEQLLVTPLSAGQLIAGKVIPFIILSYVELAIATTVAILWFGLPFLGSVFVFGLCAFVFLVVALGGGLLTSTVSQTQSQAMLTIWFFLMFGIMTSGFFYPVENMPTWIYYLTYLNPMRYIMAINRGIFLKGATFVDVLPNLIPMAIMGVAVFGIAVLRFRKRLA
jgi:ABC-2 type transport system permease protein